MLRRSWLCQRSSRHSGASAQCTSRLGCNAFSIGLQGHSPHTATLVCAGPCPYFDVSPSMCIVCQLFDKLRFSCRRKIARRFNQSLIWDNDYSLADLRFILEVRLNCNSLL